MEWSTLTETNNNYFTVQRSKDGISFEEVLRIRATGNSTVTLNYKTKDLHPLSGHSYYRLKQTDFNGMFKYSNIASVTISENADYSIYPNPSNTSKTFVTIRGNRNEKVTVAVYDNIGKETFRKTFVFEHSGETTITIEPSLKLVRGIYTVVIIAGENLYKHKLAIN
jgi:hypothetical protein